MTYKTFGSKWFNSKWDKLWKVYCLSGTICSLIKIKFCLPSDILCFPHSIFPENPHYWVTWRAIMDPDLRDPDKNIPTTEQQLPFTKKRKVKVKDIFTLTTISLKKKCPCLLLFTIPDADFWDFLSFFFSFSPFYVLSFNSHWKIHFSKKLMTLFLADLEIDMRS